MNNNSRQTGSYYTTGKVAEIMSNWAIRKPEDILLEPSFGDGVFIDTALHRYQGLGNDSPNIHAVELREPPFSEYIAKCGTSLNAYLSDFLEAPLKENVDAVIGNPPYVSLKNLTGSGKTNATGIMEKERMAIPSNGSLWFPFVVHATSFVKQGGRLAFVLPYEIAYVKYAATLWKFLADNYSDIALIRVFEDFFPSVDVETILLFCEGKGGRTEHIDYAVYNTVDDLVKGRIHSRSSVHIRNTEDRSKPFTSALLSDEQTLLLMKLADKGIVEPIINSCKFKIGYVSADKEYFHPAPNIVEMYSIPEKNLIPSILNSKSINGGTGIGLKAGRGQCASKLYLPTELTEGDLRYIEKGVMADVPNKYKCRQRKPWYVTPGVEIPDMIVSVFGDVPKMIINEGGYAASNSMLCGTLKNGVGRKDLVCRWYNSLTLLSIELQVHSLGGGSLVIIPGEADSLSIVKSLPNDRTESIFEKLDCCVKGKGLSEAYRLGDELVLKDVLGITEKQIGIIRENINDLRRWRIPGLRRALS